MGVDSGQSLHEGHIKMDIRNENNGCITISRIWSCEACRGASQIVVHLKLF